MLVSFLKGAVALAVHVLKAERVGEIIERRHASMRAVVSPRSSAQLTDAGHCLQRAAVLGRDEMASSDREQCVRQAVACFRAAQAV